jgi:CRISP-associated protein Cas1
MSASAAPPSVSLGNDAEPRPREVARAKALPLVPIEEQRESPLIPVRMINEVMYCERLMYLEWIEGQWADNYYTVDGKAVHRRADKGTIALAPAAPLAEDGEPLPYTARSVWLSSEPLGITGKLDVVDVEGTEVVPVEYKRGKKPDIPGGAYLPEQVQLCAQVLLLREHGFTCDHGDIYYAKDRQRHSIPIDDMLIAQTHRAIERVRELAENGQLPEPLRNSPKCNGCSLVGICLPDEVTAIEQIESIPPPVKDPFADSVFELGDDPWGLGGTVPLEPVRRLFPARDDRLAVYVQEQGSSLRLDGERLVVQVKDGATTQARLGNTLHVALYGNVHVTSPALRALLERNIPTLFFTYGGWYQGRTITADSKNVELRLAQYDACQSEHFGLRLARGFVASKILNCRTLLRRNHAEPSETVLSELKQLARKARNADNLASLLGIEGTAARVYFGQFTGMLKGDAAGEFDFDGRNRRPPRDPVNAMLSFCYSMLAKELLLAVTVAGLDSMLGFYHRPHFGRHSLALDLMEEFRPIIADSVVINALNTNVIQADDFIRAAGAVTLTNPARKRLILAFERRMDQLVTHPVFDYRISYRRVLEVQARLLSRLLLGDIRFYPEFRVR